MWQPRLRAVAIKGAAFIAAGTLAEVLVRRMARRALAGGHLRIVNGRVLDEHGRELAKGFDLTKEIEATIANEIVRDTT